MSFFAGYELGVGLVNVAFGINDFFADRAFARDIEAFNAASEKRQRENQRKERQAGGGQANCPPATQAGGAGDKPPGGPPRNAADMDEANEPGGGSTPTDRLKEQLFERAGKAKSQTALDAARRELAGQRTGYDHVTKVRNAQQGLLNRIQGIQRELGNSGLSEPGRAALRRELGEASRLLDYSRGFVP